MIIPIISLHCRPSQHEGFDPTETLYRQTYEDAERSGFVGENCASLYPKCESDLLSLLSYTEF